jgi:hypothetical protein
MLHLQSREPSDRVQCYVRVTVWSAGSRIHNEAVAMSRLSAEHHQGSQLGLKAGGSINKGSMNSHHSQNSNSSLPQANGTNSALPKAV